MTNTPPTAGASPLLAGGCHCARLSVAFTPGADAASLQPRACDCAFCTRHGAAWVSDPAGRLVLHEHEAGALREYRQGSNTARFLFCGHCAVLVAVVFEHQARLYGAINARCLDVAGVLDGTVTASPQTLAPADKVARWQVLWVPDVAVVRA